MEILVLLLIMFFLGALMDKASRNADKRLEDLRKKIKEREQGEFVVEERPKEKDFVVEDVKKVCPPHKWRYQEVRDTEGNVIRFRIICDICGPLKPSDGPARLG